MSKLLFTHSIIFRSFTHSHYSFVFSFLTRSIQSFAKDFQYIKEEKQTRKMALHIPKAPGVPQMMKDGARVSPTSQQNISNHICHVRLGRQPNVFSFVYISFYFATNIIILI